VAHVEEGGPAHVHRGTMADSVHRTEEK
jgi:hypothetical protein